MKKRLIGLILCAIMITACSKASNEKNIEEISETTSSDSNKEKDSSESTKTKSSLYELFLKNEEKVYIENANWGYYSENEEANGYFTLDEIVDYLIDSYTEGNTSVETKLESIEYSYIDCGNDGNEELALKIYTPGIDAWTEYLIIKEYEGKLRTVYTGVGWSRGQPEITRYGYILSDGSCGASYHVFDKEYVDENGELHYIYSNYSSNISISGENAGDVWFNGEIHNVVNELGEPLYGDYTFFSMDFNNTPNDDSDNIYFYGKTGESIAIENGCRGFYYCELVDDDSIYEDTFPLKRFFNSKGLKTYSLKEINLMIENREKEAGVTEEIKNADIVTWIKLD